MKQFNLDLGITVNVFSSTSIKDAPPRLKEAMEDVAGRVEELSKSKITTAAPPQPFRKRKTQSITKYADWDARQYATDGKTSRDKRAQQRHIRVFGMQKLGLNEYRKLMQEIDQMTDPDVDVMAMVNKRIKEIRERLDAEEKEKVEGQRRQIRSRTEKAGTSTTTVESVDTRKTTGAKKPKQKDDDTVDESRNRVNTRKTTGAKKPKQKDDDTVDESRSRKKEGIKQKPTSLKVKTTEQSKRKVVTMAEDVDEDEQDLVIIERKKADVEDFDDNDDDDDYVPELDEDDDFDIPPPRARKTTQIVDKKADEELEDLADFVDRTFRKTTRKSTTKKLTAKERRVGKSTDDTEATIPLFQQIVGKNYEIMASEGVEEQMDRSINPTEAAGFRATMKSLAVGLKEAVKKGKNVEATYKDLIKSTIEVARAMRYPGAFTVEAEEIFNAIPDLKCNAWRKYIKGDEMMDPKDVVLDEEQDDLLIQGPVLGEESTQAAAKAIHNLPELLKRDAKANLVKLFDNQMKAHQYAAEACKNLKELHKTLPLEVFLRIADSAMRPLVIMHIPSTEAMCTKMCEAAEAKTKKTRAGASRVTDVMENTNLPQLQKDWTLEETYKARKMIACIIYKYVQDAMYNETTATHVVVEKFNVKQTTIHRQLYGKKYPGGGQTLKQMKERTSKTSKTEKQATTTRPVESSKISGQKKVTLEKSEVTTSKGKGKGKKSQVKRSVEEIRSASTSEVEKLRAKKRKAEESKIIEEEDEDRPMAEEIKRSKPAVTRRGLFIH